jgi:hypothetical protein
MLQLIENKNDRIKRWWGNLNFFAYFAAFLRALSG